MLHIMICEDNEVQLQNMERLVRRWGTLRKLDMEIRSFFNAEQFLFGWEEKKQADILLLDIEMPGMDGISLAHRLRRLQEQVQILFVTGMAEYMQEGYEVDAVTYLLKPVSEEKLFRGLDRALEKSRLQEPFLVAESAGEVVKIKISEISYLESLAHETAIYRTGTQENVRCKYGISKLESGLKESTDMFYRIHRSYLVNLSRVEKITRKEVVMEGGKALPIARGKWEEINRAWLDYYRKRGAAIL